MAATLSEEKRQQIQDILSDAEGAKLSNRDIAKRLGVHHEAVGRARDKIREHKDDGLRWHHPNSPDGPVEFVEIDRLTLDDDEVQPREFVSQEDIDDYAEKWNNGASFPPIVVYREGDILRVADGFLRTKGALAAGRTSIHAIIKEGDKEDAVRYSTGANRDNPKPLTAADKRKAVRLALINTKTNVWSDRQIAAHVGCSAPLVATVKDELRTVNGLQFPAKTEGKDKKIRPASRIDRKGKAESNGKAAEQPGETEAGAAALTNGEDRKEPNGQVEGSPKKDWRLYRPKKSGLFAYAAERQVGYFHIVHNFKETLTKAIETIKSKFHEPEISCGYEEMDLPLYYGDKIVAVIRKGANGEPIETIFDLYTD